MDNSSKRIVLLAAALREKANVFIIKRLADFGIKNIAPAHGSVFYGLFDGNEQAMSEIATRIHRDKSTVTTLVDKLVTLGYAEKRKDESDARITRVRLTEKGLALKPVFDEISDELLNSVYRGFSPEEQYMLVRLLRRAVDNITGPVANNTRK